MSDLIDPNNGMLRESRPLPVAVVEAAAKVRALLSNTIPNDVGLSHILTRGERELLEKLLSSIEAESREVPK